VTSEERHPWSAEAELALLAFTDLAALLIASMLLGEQQTELAAQLQSALNSRAIIEQAKGVLIGQQGLTAHDAYAQLRSQARAERRKLAIVSAEVVRGAIRADGEKPIAKLQGRHCAARREIMNQVCRAGTSGA
jgi:hypothetical protein